MGNDKKWKISVLYHRLRRSRKELPSEFICPISRSLMADPVIVSSGQTFERNCIEACTELGFKPKLKDGSLLEPSTLIPNIALKTAINHWCDEFSVPKPVAPKPESARQLVLKLQTHEEEEKKKTQIQNPVAISSETREILDGISEAPKIQLCYAETEVNRRPHRLYDSSSESVSSITPPLQLATKPSCYSSSSSSSSEIVLEQSTPIIHLEEHVEELLKNLKNPLVSEQEEAVISLRTLSRNDPKQRETLCNPRILSSLRPLLNSRYPSIQINSVAALVNLSLEKQNKVKIVRSGTVPFLIEVLKSGQPEAQEHAAGAIFSLALEDENKTAIGVLGAIPPLLHLLKSNNEQVLQDSAMAIYHLSLVQSNRNKLMKAGAIQLLMGLARGGDPALASRALLILCNIAASDEGRAALLDANGVQVFLGLLDDNSRGGERRKEKEEDQSCRKYRECVREYCVAVLYSLSQNNLRFKGLAIEGGGVDLLMEVVEHGTVRAREKAKRMLMVMKSSGEEDGYEDSIIPARQLIRQLVSGNNTTEF